MKLLKSLQTLLIVMWEYTYLLITILFGKFNLETDSFLIGRREDGESVQNQVYLLVLAGSIVKVSIF